jgi:hypothetical protein
MKKKINFIRSAEYIKFDAGWNKLTLKETPTDMLAFQAYPINSQ